MFDFSAVTRFLRAALMMRRPEFQARRLRFEFLETRNLLSIVVSSAADSGPGSLREAIALANASAGPDEIRFSLPAGSVIQSLTALPALADTSGGTTVDGDVNGDGLPDIVLRGNSFDTLSITSSDNTVRNLVIQDGWAGVHIYGNGSPADRNRVFGCYIGTDLTGMDVTGTANRGSGVWVGGITHGTVIGGSGPHEGNIIAGNGYHGIQLIDAIDATVQGNYIGLGADGSTVLGNQAAVSVSSRHVTRSRSVGRSRGRQCDLGEYFGTELFSVAIRRAGNHPREPHRDQRGRDAAVGNGWNGMSVGSSNNTIGGTADGARNVISGNGQDGVAVWGDVTAGNLIEGNYIGTDASGTAAIGNGSSGVHIGSPNNTIGGAAAGNVIAGNAINGVCVQGNVTGVTITSQCHLRQRRPGRRSGRRWLERQRSRRRGHGSQHSVELAGVVPRAGCSRRLAAAEREYGAGDHRGDLPDRHRLRLRSSADVSGFAGDRQSRPGDLRRTRPCRRRDCHRN